MHVVVADMNIDIQLLVGNTEYMLGIASQERAWIARLWLQLGPKLVLRFAVRPKPNDFSLALSGSRRMHLSYDFHAQYYKAKVQIVSL